jgi:hypothetical protein
VDESKNSKLYYFLKKFKFKLNSNRLTESLVDLSCQ